MYAQPAIRFRDPFVSQHSRHDSVQHNWASYPQSSDYQRALTPPPEMNGVQPVKPIHYPQEHRHVYGNHQTSQQAYQPAPASYYSRDIPQSEHVNNAITAQTSSRPISPVECRATAKRDNSAAPSSRRGSTAGTNIAQSFQVPRSVNDSGGSLSELASQITCLFWFESADVLQMVEDSETPIFPTRPLNSDAKPTTGFRKWVTTILSTTVVAQNVVILALLFIHRLKKLNPTVRGKPGSEYRLLTVALMLGNKFLDDNTYTNKTWAEVSGITVSEIHIMEVEFLSNMKYCLYTSAEDWAKWQSLLGRFATFFDRASKPIAAHSMLPVLPPTSSLQVPRALPSPPSSTQASPPNQNDPSQGNPLSSGFSNHGLTPAPSPLAPFPEAVTAYQNARKRSHDEQSTEPPPKRMAAGYQNYASQQPYASAMAQASQSQLAAQRLTLPSLAIPANSTSAPNFALPVSQGQHLPPLQAPARAMAMVYPNAITQAQPQHMTTSAGPASQSHSQMGSQYQSRQQSPYSNAPSPTNGAPHSATNLHPPAQVSPSYFLQQRNSPYRPVHNVSTLLYPPPSGALHNRIQNIEHNEMHYQPLGKPMQQRQSGRLPYVAQNMWMTDNQQHAMTPIQQWPSFNPGHPSATYPNLSQ